MSRRRAVIGAGLAGLLLGMLLVAVPAMAGVGDPLIIGVLNKGNKTTTLDGTVDGPLFKVFNHQGGGSAAVRINSNGPPFATNSTKRILNFNADLLDGRHGTDFRVLHDADADDNADDGDGDVLTAVIDAPSSGMIVISGVVGVQASGVAADLVTCRLSRNAVVVPASPVSVTVDGATALTRATCPSKVAVDVPAGAHTISLEVTDHDNADLRAAYLHAVFVPAN